MAEAKVKLFACRNSWIVFYFLFVFVPVCACLESTPWALKLVWVVEMKVEMLVIFEKQNFY